MTHGTGVLAAQIGPHSIIKKQQLLEGPQLANSVMNVDQKRKKADVTNNNNK
jgi:hypothetical protein